jgi:hypothetical protein
MFQAICSDDQIEGHIYHSHGSAGYEVAAKDIGSKTLTLTIRSNKTWEISKNIIVDISMTP